MLNLTDCVSYLWRLQLKNVYLDDKWVDLLPQIQNYEKSTKLWLYLLKD